MRAAPDYAVADFNRMKRAQLMAMLVRADPDMGSVVLTVKQIKEHLTQMRAQYWDNLQSSGKRTKPQAQQAITATAANEFLRSLPPIEQVGAR